MAEIEPHFQDPSVDRLSIFNYLQQQGHNENTKKYLNQVLINVVLKMKHGNGAPYDPKTVAVKMRTLFAEFSKQRVPFKLDNFSGFPGAMQDVVDQIWKSFCENDSEFGRQKKKPSRLSTMKTLLPLFLTFLPKIVCSGFLKLPTLHWVYNLA